MWWMLAATAVNMASSYAQGKGQAAVAEMQGRFEAERLEYEAQAAENEARYAEANALAIDRHSATKQITAEARLQSITGAQIVSQAGSGFEIEDRGAENRRAIRVFQREALDAAKVGIQSQLNRAHGLREQARLNMFDADFARKSARFRGKIARRGALLNMASQGLGAASSLFGGGGGGGGS